MTSTPKGQARESSWPPIVTLLIGLVMVFVAFPNPLRIPNQNPNATAELAPVPGKSQNAQGGNFGETGLGVSDGLGSGEGDDGLGPGGALTGGGDIPLEKNCIAGRQTEDLLSPPCVPYYSGNNGGKTYHGVTANEIRIVFFQDVCNVSADKEDAGFGNRYKPTDECGGSSNYQTVNLIKTIKAHLGYFNRRFQLYGRRVHLYIQGSQGNGAEARRNDAQVAVHTWDPFGVVFLGDNASDYFTELARPDNARLSFGLNFDVPRSFYDNNRPFIWSMIPDQETEAAWSASFICRKMLGGKAKFSTDPVIQEKTRKLALLYPRTSIRGASIIQLGELLKAGVTEQCGYNFDHVDRYQSEGAGAASNAQLIIGRLIEKDITTVVCYCIPVQPETTVSKFQTAASNAGYYPEWYWDHASAMDRPIWHQVYGRDGSGRQSSFGVSYLWRQVAFKQQMHYRAYREQTADRSSPNFRFNFTIYHLFLNLFTALQAAGPELTPETVDRGMNQFQYVTPKACGKTKSFAAPECSLPTGSYGTFARGPSSQTFIDTAMGWWWDRTGTPPGGRPGEGCFRVVQQGRRFYATPDAPGGDEKLMWTRGDDDLFVTNARGDQSPLGPWDDDVSPCTEDTRKISDPQAGDI